MQVTITTTNATTPIYEIVDTFANNSVASLVSDQSGDTFANRGDLNANFNEPLPAATPTSNQGIQQQTLLQQSGGVLIGPNGQPGAVGPNSNNDDYTNRSTNVGISTVADGGNTSTVDSTGVVFTNTVQNTGNANDTFTLTAPTVPVGFTVEASTDGGTNYTTLSGGGSTTVAVAYNSSAQILVRVKTTAVKPVLTGFDVIIQAASGITPANTNKTIDRYYTGFIRLEKSYTISNTDLTKGGATDPVPGATITYTIKYTNIASTGGTNNSTLTANNLVITEDGHASPNNWASDNGLPSATDHVVGATDSRSSTIGGDTAGSNVVTVTVSSLPAGEFGIFTFKRRIR
jgi:hypothetical protein